MWQPSLAEEASYPGRRDAQGYFLPVAEAVIIVTGYGALQGLNFSMFTYCGYAAMAAPGLGWCWTRERADGTSLKVEGVVGRASPGTPWEKQRSPALQISTDSQRVPCGVISLKSIRKMQRPLYHPRMTQPLLAVRFHPQQPGAADHCHEVCVQ